MTFVGLFSLLFFSWLDSCSPVPELLCLERLTFCWELESCERFPFERSPNSEGVCWRLLVLPTKLSSVMLKRFLCCGRLYSVLKLSLGVSWWSLSLSLALSMELTFSAKCSLGS